jgi:hypothetical protein
MSSRLVPHIIVFAAAAALVNASQFQPSINISIYFILFS